MYPLFLLSLSLRLYKNACAQPHGCFQLTLSLTAVFPPHLFLFIFFFIFIFRENELSSFWNFGEGWGNDRNELSSFFGGLVRGWVERVSGTKR